MNTLKKLFSSLLVLALIFSPTGWAGTSNFDAIEIASGGTITLGGVSRSSWPAASSGAFTDNGTTVTSSSAPTKLIFTISSGDLFATGLTAGTGDLTLENGQLVDGGTNGALKFTEAGDTLTLSFDGSTIKLDSSDGGFQFVMSDATEGTVQFQTNNDTDDYIEISTTSNQSLINFVGQSGKITASGGAIDFDNENLTTTGTLSSGATTVTSLIIGDDTLDVTTDDFLEFTSNDETSRIGATGFEAKDAILRLDADQGDDGGDTWELESDHSTNSLLFTNDTAVAGTQATILTLSTAGALTTTGDMNVVNDTATTNAVVDVAKFEATTTGTAANNLGVGVTYYVEDAGGSEEQASLDIVLSDVTDSSEDADLVYSANVAGTVEQKLKITSVGTLQLDGTEATDALLQLRADQSDDNGDDWQFEADTSTNDLIISNDTSGSQAAKLTIADTTGDVTLTGDIINENADSLLMNTDDDLQFLSNDEHSRISAIGFEAKEGQIVLKADQDDDATDGWELAASTSGTLTIGNDSSVAGTFVDKLTIASSGAITLVSSDVLTNVTDDKLSFQSEDESSTLQALGFEAKAASLELYADQDDDATDGWEITATTGGTLTIGNDSGAAGTDVAKITITGSSGNTAFVGDVSGDGGDQLYGFLSNQVAITTTSITAAQCGSTFVGDSADVIVLPEASTVLGCRLTFVGGTADDVDIDPADGTDEFGQCTASGGTIDGAAGDEYRITDIGTSITIEAVGANLWAVVAHNGAITDVN